MLFLPHDFMQALRKVLVVFLPLFLLVFLSFCCSSRPSKLFFSLCFRLSIHSPTLFLLKHSRGWHARWFEWGFFVRGGGLLQLGLLSALGERKSHLFFLSLHLYSLLNVMGCVQVLVVLILAPFLINLGSVVPPMFPTQNKSVHLSLLFFRCLHQFLCLCNSFIVITI